MLQILVFQVKTLIKSIDLQSKSELLTTENFLPFRNKVTVELVHKCIQQLHQLKYIGPPELRKKYGVIS